MILDKPWKLIPLGYINGKFSLISLCPSNVPETSMFWIKNLNLNLNLNSLIFHLMLLTFYGHVQKDLALNDKFSKNDLGFNNFHIFFVWKLNRFCPLLFKFAKHKCRITLSKKVNNKWVQKNYTRQENIAIRRNFQ